jgi:RNA polymerase sigma-32 factor
VSPDERPAPPEELASSSESAEPLRLPEPVAGSAVPAARPRGDVERSDALSRYMAQLRDHAPIPREEEYALALRWVEEKDLDAARRLVLANLRLVVKIAMEYRRTWTNVLDLIQEGNLGLMQAVQRFDPYQGVKLSSYAAYWIRAYILKYLLDNIRLVRLGTTRAQRKLFFRLNKEKRELERLGIEVEPRLIAERLDVTEDDVLDMEQRLGQSDLSFDAPVREDEGSATFGDFIASRAPSTEESVADEELRRVFLEKVEEFAATLDERDRRIIEERILSDEPKTLQEMGDEFGITRERVRQLEARVVSRLREFLKKNLVDFEYYAPGRD